MVKLTDRAAQVLRATLAQIRTKPGQTFRLVLKPEGGFGLGLDQARVGDEVITANGEKILLVASDIAQALDEARIDTQDTDGGRKVVICR
jgi:Fe-S cluster assembly iron-binding protein IscA